MKKLVLLGSILVLLSLAIAGCGGSSSSGSSGGGENNHTHAPTEGIENQINKFLGDVSEYKVDEILNDRFLDSRSFTLLFQDENRKIDESKNQRLCYFRT